MADTELPLIPGLDMAGRGIYLRPRQPFELNGVLFRRPGHQTYPSRETGITYRVPVGYEVNDSPPMPAAVGTGVGSAGVEAHSAKEKLQNNSECTVFGKGGDELLLATLSSLDEARYNQWLAIIKDNPQVIEFDAADIWTLVDDDGKAKALRQAYIEATVFTPPRVVFNLDSRVHVFRGKNCFSYNPDTGAVRPVKEKWPMLAEVGFEQVDATFLGKYLVSQADEKLDRKLYFFNRGQYIRVDVDAMAIDEGYPRTIADGWPGVPFERIDAAMNVAPDALYFFLGSQYVRFNMLNNHADEGYPEATSKRWAGLNFDRVDAAVYWGNAKVFFFRGNQHIRYDMVSYRADPGYPKFIFGNYAEDWQFFD